MHFYLLSPLFIAVAAYDTLFSSLLLFPELCSLRLEQHWATGCPDRRYSLVPVVAAVVRQSAPPGVIFVLPKFYSPFQKIKGKKSARRRTVY